MRINLGNLFVAGVVFLAIPLLIFALAAAFFWLVLKGIFGGVIWDK